MAKALRQNAILELVKEHSVSSQDELRRRLSRHGFKVTQGTLSRDLRQLGLVKTAAGYALPQDLDQAPPPAPPLERVLREFVKEVREAQNLLVLKTSAGSAQPVAVALDAAAWPEIVGTVAGDDTILVISPDTRTARKLASRFRETLV